MKHWSSRRVFALLLGVILGVGMSVSAVRAGDMTAKMAMASAVGDSGQACCQACGEGDDGNTNVVNCMPICVASGPALLPAGPVAKERGAAEPPVPGTRLSHGRASTPDPDPPRFTDLG